MLRRSEGGESGGDGRRVGVTTCAGGEESDDSEDRSS
jgi:hypothetical protein